MIDEIPGFTRLDSIASHTTRASSYWRPLTCRNIPTRIAVNTDAVDNSPPPAYTSANTDQKSKQSD